MERVITKSVLSLLGLPKIAMDYIDAVGILPLSISELNLIKLTCYFNNQLDTLTYEPVNNSFCINGNPNRFNLAASLLSLGDKSADAIISTVITRVFNSWRSEVFVNGQGGLSCYVRDDILLPTRTVEGPKLTYDPAGNLIKAVAISASLDTTTLHFTDGQVSMAVTESKSFGESIEYYRPGKGNFLEKRMQKRSNEVITFDEQGYPLRYEHSSIDGKVIKVSTFDNVYDENSRLLKIGYSSVFGNELVIDFTELYATRDIEKLKN